MNCGGKVESQRTRSHACVRVRLGWTWEYVVLWMQAGMFKGCWLSVQYSDCFGRSWEKKRKKVQRLYGCVGAEDRKPNSLPACGISGHWQNTLMRLENYLVSLVYIYRKPSKASKSSRSSQINRYLYIFCSLLPVVKLLLQVSTGKTLKHVARSSVLPRAQEMPHTDSPQGECHQSVWVLHLQRDQ